MTFEAIAVSDFKTLVKEPTEYHKAQFGGNKLWIFSQKFAEQKSFNWGHRVHFVGGYAVAFDPTTKKYEASIEVPALSQEEDAEEILFTCKGLIYLLLTNAFGNPSFRKLYKWNENSWEKVADLGTPQIGDDKPHLYWGIATGGNDGEKYIIGSNGSIIKVFRLRIEDDTASIELFTEVPQEVNPLNGRPVGGFINGNSLYISIGVHGCGFRWESQRYIKVDLEKKNSEEFFVEGEYKDLPSFCFSGPNIKISTKNEDWMAVSGSTQVGMSGSKFNNEIWTLTGIPSSPKWKKNQLVVPEKDGDDFIGAFDISSNTLYIVTPNHIHISTI